MPDHDTSSSTSLTDQQTRQAEFTAALKDYNQLSAGAALMMDNERAHWNMMMEKKDPDWAKTLSQVQKNNFLDKIRDDHSDAFIELKNEYDRNTNYQNAAQRMSNTAEYIDGMQNVIENSNSKKLGDINADMMTARRVAGINTENVIRIENISSYFRICIITLCVAILIMAPCVLGYISLPLANILLVVLATGMAIALIYRAYDNSNRLSMLFPEREWPLVAMNKDSDEECACPAKPSA